MSNRYVQVKRTIERVKMEAAKMSLEPKHENINKVMYNVGYTDAKVFRISYKRITGLSPVQNIETSTIAKFLHENDTVVGSNVAIVWLYNRWAFVDRLR